MSMKKYKFSHSQLQTADCSARYHIKYDLKLKSTRYSKQKALSVGKLFHAGIDVMYRLSAGPVSMADTLDDKILQEALTHVRALGKQMRNHLAPDEGELPAHFKRKLDIDFGIPLIMIEAYYNHVFMNERFEIVESEQRIETNVRTPSGRRSPNMFYVGYLDAIIKNLSGDGGNYLHEVKTAANWSEKDELFLKIDNQTTGYHWLANEKCIVIDGTIYTICLKPTSNPLLKNEAKKAKANVKNHNTKVAKEKAQAREDRTVYTGDEYMAAYEYDPIRDYESSEEYLERIRKDYIESPAKYFIRKIFTRSAQQLKRFEVELYYACRDARSIRERNVFMQPNKMKCPNCEGYDLCQNWTEETMAKWYEAKVDDRNVDMRSIILN